MARQGGGCAICGLKSRHRLVVDHCHVCDRVRGLLCHGCNLGLGNYCDDVRRLQAAIAYLQRSRRQPALSMGPGGCSCDLHIPPGTALLADPSRTILSTAREPCAAVGNCNELVHQQKGDHMTQDESAILAGAQAPAQPLPIIADAPPLAPAPDAAVAALAFEATLVADEGRAVWTVRPIEDVERIRVAALLAEGMSIRDIAEETGTPKSTVHRLKKRIEQDAAARPPETAKIEAGQ